MKPLPKIIEREASLTLPQSFDHKEPEDDDCGLPEHPIYSNYAKYLWKSHTENLRIRENLRLLRDRNGDHKN